MELKYIYIYIFLKFDRPILDFLQIEFQNRGISLISLRKEAKYWIFCTKGAKANFLRESRQNSEREDKIMRER